MARSKNKFGQFKSSALALISGLAFVLVIWLLLYGKIKATGLLAPLIGKIPRDEAGLVKITEGVLGTAIEKVKGENVQRAVEKGSEIFEKSEYAEPAREMRDDIKNKIDDVVTSAKELPAKELKTVERQVCNEWLGDEFPLTPTATPSGH